MRLPIAILMLCLSACAPHYSEGSRSGIVTKLSYKGIIWKSWEGEMVMGGMRQDEGGNAVTNVFAFNVDPACVREVQAAQDSGRAVKLVYRQWLLAPWTIENGHVIVRVETAP